MNCQILLDRKSLTWVTVWWEMLIDWRHFFRFACTLCFVNRQYTYHRCWIFDLGGPESSTCPRSGVFNPSEDIIGCCGSWLCVGWAWDWSGGSFDRPVICSRDSSSCCFAPTSETTRAALWQPRGRNLGVAVSTYLGRLASTFQTKHRTSVRNGPDSDSFHAVIVVDDGESDPRGQHSIRRS